MHKKGLKLLAATLLFASAARAGTTVDISAEATRAARNDLIRATLFAEATGSASATAARHVNTLIGEAITTAKEQPKVKVQTGSTHTYPIYAKGGRIESWRMRSEIILETQDIPALSELVGNLQTTLGVAGVSLTPSPETRKKAENEATLEAITAFKVRAKLVADTFGQSYRIKHLNIGRQDFRQPTLMLRAAPMAAAMENAPMPMEAGESSVSVTVNGQIEISD